jgi:hypothetical protein
MTMTNFSDQLFHDLMQDHGPALRAAELTAPGRRLPLRRGAWLAGGAGALAVGITASLAAFGGAGSQAYAITPHSDGTVTVAVMKMSGVTGANATLHQLGTRVVVVPVRPGCPSLESLPAPSRLPGKVSGSIRIGTAAGGSKDGSITVQAKGIPAGDLLVIAVASTSHGTTMAARLTAPPAPACVTMPAGVPAPGKRAVTGHGPGGAVVQTTGPGSRPASSAAAG